MKQNIEEIEEAESKAIENDSHPVAVQTERVFVWLRQNVEQKKNSKEKVAVSEKRSSAIRSRSMRDFINRIFYTGKNNYFQLSQLNEIESEQNFAFKLKKSFDAAVLRRASIHLKKEIDSFNYLLPLSSIFLSCSVLLIAYGIFLDSFLDLHQTRFYPSKLYRRSHRDSSF